MGVRLGDIGTIVWTDEGRSLALVELSDEAVIITIGLCQFGWPEIATSKRLTGGSKSTADLLAMLAIKAHDEPYFCPRVGEAFPAPVDGRGDLVLRNLDETQRRVMAKVIPTISERCEVVDIQVLNLEVAQ